MNARTQNLLSIVMLAAAIVITVLPL